MQRKDPRYVARLVGLSLNCSAGRTVSATVSAFRLPTIHLRSIVYRLALVVLLWRHAVAGKWRDFVRCRHRAGLAGEFRL